jgi:polyphosphate kinase
VTKATGLNLALLLDEAAHLVHTQLLPRVQRYRVQIAAIEQLNDAQQAWLWHYFQQQVYPLLTPFAVDSGHPFPFIQDRRLNFLVVLQSKDKTPKAEQYGLVQIPARLPRLIQAQPPIALPVGARNSKPIRCFVWREEVVRYFLPMIFNGVNVKAVYQFRLLRAPLNNSPAMLIEPEQRTSVIKGPITQLAVEKAMPGELRQWLVKRLPVSMDRLLACALPLGMADLCELADHLSLH